MTRGALLLSLPDGVAAEVLPLGATLHALGLPDRQGRFADVLAGPATAADHAAVRGYFGVTVGRVANRIARARFTLAGEVVQVAVNDGPHALHGGPDGFDRRVWAVEAEEPQQVRLTLESPDGDQGFPGHLTARVTYRLDPPARLTILMEASVTRPCPVNLTNHAFFNLGGAEEAETFRSVLDHEISVAASSVLFGDADGIPVGAPVPVAGTPFDLRQAQRVGRVVRSAHPQILARHGLDHNFCLDGAVLDGTGLRHAARLADPASGRVIDLLTDRPGLQVYSGNFLDGSRAGKGGIALRSGDAICLEPQDWPDAVNRPDFPSCLLQPGETYRHEMVVECATL